MFEKLKYRMEIPIQGEEVLFSNLTRNVSIINKAKDKLRINRKLWDDSFYFIGRGVFSTTIVGNDGKPSPVLFFLDEEFGFAGAGKRHFHTKFKMCRVDDTVVIQVPRMDIVQLISQDYMHWSYYLNQVEHLFVMTNASSGMRIGLGSSNYTNFLSRNYSFTGKRFSGLDIEAIMGTLPVWLSKIKRVLCIN